MEKNTAAQQLAAMRWSKIAPEKRSEIMRKVSAGRANLTPASRSAIARKAAKASAKARRKQAKERKRS